MIPVELIPLELEYSEIIIVDSDDNYGNYD
ncbi:hypothetical protein SAMN04488156_12222 [Bacillus sp. 166amftsu]|nr:hypothetical protein SAMN04488156_12222 [Bacillus sp. 166amftsu]